MNTAIAKSAPAKINNTDHYQYVLITPARNEEAFIGQTIESVVAQTVLPAKWVIVSDGSTDRTDDIVKQYTAKYNWIQLVRMPERTERHFAGKVLAFNAGYEQVQGLKYDIVGSLDADISFDPEYFEFLLGQFARNTKLGVAGTPFREGTTQYDYRFSRKEHVSGACQLFRRECFESIGGYVPIKAGAIDLTAVVTARMKDWKTETFTDKFCLHHRKMGTAKANIVIATFKSGYGDYQMGVHPLWQIARSTYQMTRQPFILGGLLLLTGYFWAMFKRSPKPVSTEFVNFRRQEQMQWLGGYCKKGFGLLGQRNKSQSTF
ncbi:MAG TPA: glycosyltransferase family 2 protein [Methylobacter sp.]|jgi:glycosyltransferase involved in cell wall biosynthesis